MSKSSSNSARNKFSHSSVVTIRLLETHTNRRLTSFTFNMLVLSGVAMAFLFIKDINPYIPFVVAFAVLAILVITTTRYLSIRAKTQLQIADIENRHMNLPEFLPETILADGWPEQFGVTYRITKISSTRHGRRLYHIYEIGTGTEYQLFPVDITESLLTPQTSEAK